MQPAKLMAVSSPLTELGLTNEKMIMTMRDG
jgi:hypothetical protein